MSSSIEIIAQFAPMAVCLLAAIPILFLYAFNKRAEKPQPANYHGLIVYLIVLVLISIATIVVNGIELMPINNSDRSLFICSILIIACIDQCLNMLPVREKLQFDLTGLLLYSIILLCGMPILWQISRHTIPQDISSRTGLMDAMQIGLMLALVIFCIVQGLIKKIKHKQI